MKGMMQCNKIIFDRKEVILKVIMQKQMKGALFCCTNYLQNRILCRHSNFLKKKKNRT